MSQFCNRCRNILTFMPVGFFACNHCDLKFPMNSEDTLLSSTKQVDPNESFATYLSVAFYDPAIKVVEEECKTCGENYRVAHLGTNLTTRKLCKCTEELNKVGVYDITNADDAVSVKVVDSAADGKK